MKATRSALLLVIGLSILSSADAGSDEGRTDLRRLGQLATRPACDIAASNWSIGGETLDRDFAVYANYKKYLGPLGVKAIRLQGGWAKTEKRPGVYEWQWLDDIVNDAIAQGVQPWIETSYGNPIYPEGGGTGLGAGLPRSPEALRAWDAWVRALVGRYKDRVREWEVWNEPDGHGATADAYAKLYLRTAAIIRAEQPRARIYALALANTRKTDFAETLLKLAQQEGQLGLIDAVTIHGYPKNPDDTVPVDRFRDLVARYSSKIEVRQGETGAPSGETVGALRDVSWTEHKQAKWDLRRMLAHHGKDVPFNLFTLSELKYAQATVRGMNRKGLLRCNDDMTVIGPKPAYFATQRVFSTFDDSLRRIADVKLTAPQGERVAAHGYRKAGGDGTVVAVWLSGAAPADEDAFKRIDLAFSGVTFTDPVYADLLTGDVYALPRDRWSSKGAATTFTRMPIYDSPVLIADRTALRIELQERK